MRATILALMALFIAPGCRDTRTFGDSLAPEERIVVLFPQAVRGQLDPRLNTRAWPGKIVHLVFEGVVSVHNERLAPRPALAQRIHQPRPEVYEITLRPDARFHDGSPVLADDVLATYESVRRPSLGSPFRSLYDRIASMERLGPRRLRLTLEAPHAPFLSDLSLGVLPRRIIGPDGHLTAEPVGAGPYRIRARTGEREVVLQRFDDYWRGRPKTPYLVFKTVRDENTRLLALLGGAADLVQNAVTPRLTDAMRARPDLQIMGRPGVAYAYLALNLRDPPLNDLRVRRAIAHAIDRKRLIHHKFRGVARAATGMLPTGHWAYSGEVPTYPHDPALARRLLDEAGFVDPPGPAPRFRLSFKTTTDKFRRNLVRLMADDLGEVGVEVDAQAVELSTLLADAKGGNFQLYTLSWGDPSEPHLYNWLFHSDRIPTPDAPNRGGNRGAYQNPRVDALIDAGRIATDRTTRARIYRELQAILAQDLPYISLWHEDVVAIARTGLRGYAPLPNASLFGLWQAEWTP